MNPLKTAMSGLLLICFFGVLAAAEFPDNDTQVDDSTATEPLSGSWQKNLTTSGIQHDNSVGHSKAGFVRHTIGDDTRLLSYEIYLIADPHIGGVAAYPDYNKPGYSPLLDFDWRDGEGKDRMGGPNGSYPGRFLNYAVQLINEHFDYADGVSRYCVVLGDLTNTAERAEFQHAKIKLDSLDCPWVPLIGNHDTWA